MALDTLFAKLGEEIEDAAEGTVTLHAHSRSYITTNRIS